MPQQNNDVDNGVYVLQLIHSAVTIRKSVLTWSDIRDNFRSSITSSNAFKYSPLDIWRIRSELFIFAQRLAKMYQRSKRQCGCSKFSIPLSPAQLPATSHVGKVSSPGRKGSQYALPSHLDYSFLSSIIEVGDVIDYRLRASKLIIRATVVAIVLAEDEVTKTLKLNNGDRVIDSLHLVRRVSMRNIHTNEPMWNPIRSWKELSSVYMYPTEYAVTQSLIVDDPEMNAAACKQAWYGMMNMWHMIFE